MLLDMQNSAFVIYHVTQPRALCTALHCLFVFTQVLEFMLWVIQKLNIGINRSLDSNLVCTALPACLPGFVRAGRGVQAVGHAKGGLCH
jgi:hypothetical protein